MRLVSLELTNFRQHADSRITFDGGLTGIIGPNGAGKSTILEAIAWALYGTAAARGTRDTIRFNRAAPRSPVRVELQFEIGPHRYRVARELTKAELFLDGGMAPIASGGTTAVTDYIQRRLRMTRDEFFKTYFTGQKELAVMAQMTSAERGQFLSRVLGYERLRDAQTLANDRRRQITAEGQGLRQAMPDPDAVAKMLSDAEERLSEALERVVRAEQKREEGERAVAEITPRWEAAQRDRDRHHALLAELGVAESEARSLMENLERVRGELAQMDAHRMELERIAAELAPLAAVASELERLEHLYREEGRRRTLLESDRATAEELVRLSDQRNRLGDAAGRVAELGDVIARDRAALAGLEEVLEAKRTDWIRDKQEADTKRAELRKQYAELKEQRQRLLDAGETGKCPTCGRPLGDHYRSVQELLDAQMETIRVDGRYFANRFEQLAEAPEDLVALEEQRRAAVEAVTMQERRLAKAQQAVQELERIGAEMSRKEERLKAIRRDLAELPVGYDPVRHAEVRREAERLRPLGARSDRLSALIEKEPVLRAEHAKLEIEGEEIRERLESLAERMRKAAFSEKEFVALRAAYDRALEARRVGEYAFIQAETEAKSAREQKRAAEAHQRSLAENLQRLERLTVERKLHEELDRAYKDLRTDLNFQLRPEISELASAFLAELTDGRYSEIELDDEYNVIVLEDGVPKPVLSGGEEDLANLVLRLAISQMIAERAGQHFSLLILDEVFGSLDEQRRSGVVDLLRKLQDRFEQIVLITHIESVREGLDNILAVTYDPETGASKVDRVGPEPDAAAA